MVASILVALCCGLPARGAHAAEDETNTEGPRGKIASLYRQQKQVKPIWRAALSADGARIAWAVEKQDGAGEEIYAAHLPGAKQAERVTASASAKSCWEHDPVWSREGTRLAFLSDCATPGQAQLFVQDFGEALPRVRQITHLTGFLSHPQWSPKGESIGLLFVPHASRAPSPMAAENKAVGVIDELQNTDVQHLAIVDLQSGETTEVSPRGLYVFEYDWSPDGRQFAFTAAVPPGDDNWYIARLYTQSRAKVPPQEIYKPHLQIALPRWSPDGKAIGFIEGLMSDEGGTGGEIYTVSASGGTPRDLTPGRRSTPSWFRWLTNASMLITEFTGGSTSIGELDVQAGTTKSLWEGAESIRGGSEENSLAVMQTATGVPFTALIRASWSTLPEVWAGPIGEWQRVTAVNEGCHLPMPKFENITWNNEGYRVQGWLLYPSNYNSAKKYPMLVAVHGGPAWIARPEWRAADFNTTLFTNFGYFVFFPNARGSYGMGEKFTQANRRDWGFGDLRDMLAGVDAVEKSHGVDDSRIGILGWSYGGSTAMMAVTQTNRFRAAVAGAGAADWQSYYGQNSIDKWMIPYFGVSVYDDPEAYLRCSAITYIKKAKTPTLVLVGEHDGEAPPAQSLEFWHALKELGVPTTLVIYPDEGHSFFKQADQIDVMTRTLNWFDRHLNGR